MFLLKHTACQIGFYSALLLQYTSYMPSWQCSSS